MFVYLDTVLFEYDSELAHRPASQSRHEFFRDLMNKPESLCNFRTSRRIRAGSTFELAECRASVSHWSGDHIRDMVFRFGTIVVKLNGRALIASTPSAYAFNFPDIEPVRIISDDDIEASLFFNGATPWEPPRKTVLEPYEETTVSELKWPDRLPTSVRSLLPAQRMTTTRARVLERPVRGSALVTLELVGTLTLPIGAS